jgi:hypothetical protein
MTPNTPTPIATQIQNSSMCMSKASRLISVTPRVMLKALDSSCAAAPTAVGRVIKAGSSLFHIIVALLGFKALGIRVDGIGNRCWLIRNSLNT